MHHVLLLPRLDLCVPKLGDCWREPILGIPRGVTLPPIIMEVRKHGSLPIVVPFQIQTLFHFHDCGRKSNSGKQRARFPEKNNLEKTVVSRTLLFPNQPFFWWVLYLPEETSQMGHLHIFLGGQKKTTNKYENPMGSTWDHLWSTHTAKLLFLHLPVSNKHPGGYTEGPRKLTYPTWGKGKSSSKETFYGIC